MPNSKQKLVRIKHRKNQDRIRRQRQERIAQSKK